MKILKSLAIAFSVYSRIPVPQFEWREEDMRYTLCFFPWVGAVIGVCIYLWNDVCKTFTVGEICRIATGAAIPLLITGGFHVDGFMDTMDAFRSYQSRERKLEILKDSHIGAFAVIMLAVYGLVYLGAFSEIRDERLLKILCCGFFLSRCLSGISAVSFPLARKEGSLSFVANSSQKKLVRCVLVLQALACMVLMLFWRSGAGLAVTAAAFLAFAYYYYRSKKELGGITGDTAGYFVLLCEGCMTVAAAAMDVLY